MTGDSRLDAIRELAYAKWENAGCPDGDGTNFWLDAEREIENSIDHTAEEPIENLKKSKLPPPPLKLARVASQTRKKAS